MKLYYAPSACSLAVHIALREAGVQPDLVKVDLATHRLPDGTDFATVNLRNYVPVLELDDGSRHTEVAALLQHVGDTFPASGLVPPAATVERLAVNGWLTFVSTELHKAFSPWLWHKETADTTRQAVKEKIRVRVAELDALLAGRPYIAGARFTAADAYAYTILRWAPMTGVDLKAFTHVAAYMQRIGERPAVQAALAAEAA